MRLFVAITLDDDIRSALSRVQAGLGRECNGVRWIPAEQLHVTVKFLGEVPDANVTSVAEAMTRGAARATPFSMDLGGCGCFPPRGGVRIVWAGIHEESGALLRCADVVEQELVQIGFQKERRPFSGHITIGRVREDRSHGRIRSAAEAFQFDPVSQSVSTVTLMSSVLSPQGPTYTPVGKANLGRTNH